MTILSPSTATSRPAIPAHDPALAAFGAHLRACRRASGMTQEDLAAASQLHWTYISQIERGMRNLTYKSLLMLAAGLGTTPARLMPDTL
jgi:transcriptional regulator with XRE-family HTH domain